MFFKNKNGEYLNSDNVLSVKREDAVLINEEIVGNNLVRFKIENRYISCHGGKVFLNEIKDDTSLLHDRNGYFVTVSGNYLTLSNKLAELVADNNEIEPDLIVEYLSLKEELYYKFKRDGIVSWKLSDFDIAENLLASVRDKILGNKNARIGQLLYEVEESEEFLKIGILKELLNMIYENEEYHLTTFSSNTLRKDVDERGFHVDYPYHNLPQPYPDKILGVQVNFSLDDFRIDNGATIYVPNSYKSHRFPPRNPGNVEYMLAEKGSVILYRGDMWHTQGVNSTDNPRVALLANFSPLTVRAKDFIQLGNSDFVVRDGKVFI